VSHVAETSEGAFWVAYERSLGVSRLWFRQGRLEVRTFTRRDGLHSDHVLFLGVDFHKRLWVGSDSGVDVRDGERWLHYQQRDGLIWDDCNPNAFLAEPDGTVWIGTSRGLARYLAQSTTMPVPPPQVALSSILFDGRPVDSFPSHRIPFARAHFTAGLAALAFLSEGDVRFRHRLAGYDDGWVETDQPEVGYRKLPPGDYTLEAMARNSVGEWGEAAALVSFHVLPPWYMTFWFRLLAISAVLGVAWVLWQWKTRNYQLEQQRLEKAVAERTEELQRQKATVEAQKQEIESLLEKANQASRLKSEFLANMSHEIRTPMNGVLGMLALALETELTPDQRDYLTTSRASAQSLLSLLNEILDLSRIETNRLNLEDVPFSLRETVGAAVHALRSDASQKALSLAFRVNDDIPDLLQGDPHRLRQVLLNLIGNAIKFTHTGGIAITAELESFSDAGLTLRFQVSDTGIGIPPELQAAIFQPFEQADGATTRRYGGSGLGLAISKSLVELMGGQIRVESTPGQGSNFHFTVRLGVARETLPERPVEAAVPLPAAQPRRVLLAEDNEVNRRVVESLLMRRGHQVACATDGKAAVEMAGRETFDLILMDVQMPEMDGLRATAAIRESEAPAGAHVPIVAMTASAMKGDREKCLAAGMDDYLAKPVHPGCLYEMIERWCGVAQRPA
jgi:signal transduction histidine kinase